ncbi:MAG: DUF429 domain-containing protein [Propionibacteriales bacterium]|nr:DUF429 domain-containing protein [Propionibacteriales bacterium]
MVSYVGIDLAWKAGNRTGLAVVDGSGRLRSSGVVRSDDQLFAWLDEHAPGLRVVAVDAPLVVPNATGQRAGENELARAYGRYRAGPYSSSRSIPYFDPPRAETIAAARGWVTDPEHVGTEDRPACIEVYPHPAMVGLFGLGERVLYKKGPDRQSGFAQVVELFETLEVLGLGDHPRWQELARIVAAPLPGQLTQIEDEIDAVLCAHLAWLWAVRREELHVYGSGVEGYIVAPPPPTHAAVRSR